MSGDSGNFVRVKRSWCRPTSIIINNYLNTLGEARGIEQEANNFAKDMLISPVVWANITKGKSNSLNVYSLIRSVANNAKQNGISPTIAMWRFKYETGVYKIPGYKSLPIK